MPALAGSLKGNCKGVSPDIFGKANRFVIQIGSTLKGSCPKIAVAVEESSAVPEKKLYLTKEFPALLRGCAVARLRGSALNKRHQMFEALSLVASCIYPQCRRLVNKKLGKMMKKRPASKCLSKRRLWRSLMAVEQISWPQKGAKKNILQK